jgi:hypothetical protein
MPRELADASILLLNPISMDQGLRIGPIGSATR